MGSEAEEGERRNGMGDERDSEGHRGGSGLSLSCASVPALARQERGGRSRTVIVIEFLSS